MIELFVPGRLCLFGEHSDWAGRYRADHPELSPGHCLATGTEQGLTAEAERLDDAFAIESALPDGTAQGPARFDPRPDVLEAAAREGSFFSYAAGVASVACRRYPVRGLGLRIVHSDLPIRRGLSSSAAVCVLVARAYGQTYGLGLSPRMRTIDTCINNILFET